MEYKIVKADGYILGVAEVPFGGNIDKAEFDKVTNVINQMPEPPDGYGYKLKENLEWELYKLPVDEIGEE